MGNDHQRGEESAATRREDAVPCLSSEDLALEGGELLPDKEVLSILDLFVNLDLALDLAAPIDLAIAANANLAAPIDAAASANVLSFESTSVALAQQEAMINQQISGEAIASADQVAVVAQPDDAGAEGGGTGGEGAGDEGTDDGGGSGATTPLGDLSEGPLLNVEVNLDLDADIAAPIAGAVAANANVAAPIDAAVSANIASVDSTSTAVANQTAIINQELNDVTASATADQDAEISQ